MSPGGETWSHFTIIDIIKPNFRYHEIAYEILSEVWGTSYMYFKGTNPIISGELGNKVTVLGYLGTSSEDEIVMESCHCWAYDKVSSLAPLVHNYYGHDVTSLA